MEIDENKNGNVEVPAQGNEPVPENSQKEPSNTQSTESTGGQENTNGVENTSTEKKTGAWRSQLSKDLRDNEAFAGYETMSDFAKDALKWKEGFKGEDDTAEDEQGWKDFENREWNDEDDKTMMVEFGKVLKASGIKAKDADKLILALVDNGIKFNAKQVERQIAIQNAELKKRWGDDFENNNMILNATVKKMYSKNDIDRMLKQGKFNDPDFCDLLVKHGKANQDKFVDGAKTTEPKTNGRWGSWN